MPKAIWSIRGRASCCRAKVMTASDEGRNPE
jgi:hypothetical protein